MIFFVFGNNIPHKYIHLRLILYSFILTFFVLTYPNDSKPFSTLKHSDLAQLPY